MNTKTDLILKEVLEEIEPSNEDFILIENSLKDFLKNINGRIKKEKIKAEIFIGGSYARKTLIKKNNYDIDIFLRFEKEYKNKNISRITGKLLKGIRNVSVIHGSRDYFRIKISSNIIFELIPVIKVKNPEDAENITDLSYFHVQYIKKKAKTNKILEDIKLAKVFCYAGNCYGAESYIKGFSGYSLELLICHYGSFLKFVKAISKMEKKEIIDIEKIYRNKNNVLLDLNTAKLNSPIILIDPTYKHRNALAALSQETFNRFRAICISFLKNPGRDFFRIHGLDLEEARIDAAKKKYEFISMEAYTKKQEGDVAGSKLLKFFNHLEFEISKFFDIKKKGFEYKGGKTGRYFFAVKKKEDIIINGPETKDKENIKKFKRIHKNVFEKNRKVYAREKVKMDLREFVEFWKGKNERKMNEMSILKIN